MSITSYKSDFADFSQKLLNSISSLSFPTTETLIAVLIVGKAIDASTLYALYNKPGYLIIDDNKKPITRQGLTDALFGKIDHTTRLDLHFHGTVMYGAHVLWLKNFPMMDTKGLFSILKECSAGASLQIHLWSCYSGAAQDVVAKLGEGSMLFTYSSSKHDSLDELSMHAHIKALNQLEKQPDKYSAPLAEFIDNLSANMLQEVSIATYINGAIYKCSLNTTLYEVIANPTKVLEAAKNKIINFSKTIASRSFSFGIEEPIDKIFSEEDKEELQLGYLIHTCNIGRISAINKLIANNQTQRFQELINKDVGGVNPLMIAIRRGNEVLAEILIENKANVNTSIKANTPLILTVRNNKINLAKLLIKHNADIDQLAGNMSFTTSEIRESYYNGDVDKFLADEHQVTVSALMLAANDGLIEFIELFIQHGANLNISRPYDLMTPLHFAVFSEKDEAVKILLDHGADPNTSDFNGYTPLCTATKLESIKNIKELMNANACLHYNIATLQLCSPYDIAKRSGNAEVIKLIKDAIDTENTVSHQSDDHHLEPAGTIYFLQYNEPGN